MLFGPEDGQLEHDPDDGSTEVYSALSAPRAILVEAVFHNPHPDADTYWSHGFHLKKGRSNHSYWVGIKSTEVWRHFYRLGSSEQRANREINTSDINTSPGASNLLQVVQLDEVGWVYVNGVYQGSLSMDADTGGDQVRIYVSDKEPGLTQFEDFTVWELDPAMYRDFPEVDPDHVPPPTPTPNPKVPIFGPESGRIHHEPDDGYIAQYGGPKVSGDVMVEVTFEVPFAPNESHWNFGLQFDVERPSTYHWIEISGEFGGRLNHWRLSGSDSKLQGRLAEDLVGLNLQKGDTNHIRIIVVGDSGWVYVNDRRVTIINFSLGDIPKPDQIDLMILDTTTRGPGYDKGGYTKFEDFTVWKWHPSLFDLPDDN